MNIVLVTGASGFIGRHTLAPLSERGFRIHAVARHPLPDPAAEWHEVDLLDSEQRRSLIDAVRPTHLLHLAWEARHGYFWQAPENLDWAAATLDLVRRFQEKNGRRIVVAGTCAEYDWSPPDLDRVDCREQDSPTRPATLYGVAKVATQQLVSAFARETALSSTWGRVFFPYGPFEPPDRLVPSIIRAIQSGRIATIDNGSVVRDFLHVRDVATALALLTDSAVEGPVNIASGAGIALADLGNRLVGLIGGTDLLTIKERDTGPDNPARLVGDVTRLKHEVGFAPAYELDDGLLQTAGWWQGTGQ